MQRNGKNNQYPPEKGMKKQASQSAPYANNLDMKKVIQNYQFSINNIIYRNNNSEIYVGIDRKNQKQVAIKAIVLNKVITKQQKQDLQNEIKYCKSLPKHKNLVSVFDVFCSANNCYFMMEKYSTDLKNLLKKKKVFQQQQFMNFFIDIMHGVRYLVHTNGLLHCDIRLSNILITSDGIAKLTDFAKCKDIRNQANFSDKQQFLPQQWTPYMCPQTLVTKKFTERNQVWSLGVLAYQCLHGYRRFPWDFKNYSQLLEKAYENNIQYGKNLSEECKDFLKTCLNPKLDVSITNLFEHRWIKKYTKRKIQEKNNQFQTSKPFKALNIKSEEHPNKKLRSNSTEKHELISPTLQRITTNQVETNQEKISTQQCIQNQVCYMRFLSIILKQDQMSSKQTIIYKDKQHNYSTGVRNLYDAKLFRMILIKQTIAQRESLKQIINSQNYLLLTDENSLRIPNIQDYVLRQENKNKIEKIRKTLLQYDHKYKPFEVELVRIVDALKQGIYKHGTKQFLEWRPKDIVCTDDMRRRQSLSIYGIKLTIQKCRVLWKQIQIGLLQLKDDSYSNRIHQIKFQIQTKCLRLDFLMSYFIISGQLLDSYNDPAKFAQRNGLNLILNCKPVKIQIENIPLMEQKMKQLKLI